MKQSEILTNKLNELKRTFDEYLDKVHSNGGFDSEASHQYKDKLNNLYDEIEDLKQSIAVEKRRELNVGDGCTYHLYTDAHACTVIKRTPKSITIQQDKATLNPTFKPDFIIGGFCAHCTNQNEQSYTYEPDSNGKIITARWSEKYGAYMYLGKRITVGRHEFYDYNF